jgi:hypothetical protein
VRDAATITVQAYPGPAFEGRVAFVYPTVKAQGKEKGRREIRPFQFRGKDLSIVVHLLDFEEIFRLHPMEQMP